MRQCLASAEGDIPKVQRPSLSIAADPVDEHVYAAIRVQRESAAERTTLEHRLPVPANQRNDDSVQDRGHHRILGIAARRRWRCNAR